MKHFILIMLRKKKRNVMYLSCYTFIVFGLSLILSERNEKHLGEYSFLTHGSNIYFAGFVLGLLFPGVCLTSDV